MSGGGEKSGYYLQIPLDGEHSTAGYRHERNEPSSYSIKVYQTQASQGWLFSTLILGVPSWRNTRVKSKAQDLVNAYEYYSYTWMLYVYLKLCEKSENKWQTENLKLHSKKCFCSGSIGFIHMQVWNWSFLVTVPPSNMPKCFLLSLL